MGIKQKIRTEGNAYFSAQVPDISAKLFGQVPVMEATNVKKPFFRKQWFVPFSSVSILATSAIVVAIVLGNSGHYYPGLTPLNTVNLSPLQEESEYDYAGSPLDYDLIQPFAIASAQALFYEDQNLVYSPLSAYLALSSLLEASANQTYDQIANALNVEDIDTLRQNMHGFMQLLNYEYEDIVSQKRQTTISKVANGIFVNKAYEVKEAYLTTLANDYFTEVFHTDFSMASRQGVANWVNGKTNGFLNIKPENISFSPETIFTIYNTLYSKFFWNTAYPKTNTNERTFTNTATDTTQTAEFMSKVFIPNYAEKNDDYELVIEDIRHGMKMHIVLPKSPLKVEDILLDDALMSEILAPKDLGSIDAISLFLPKFSFKNRLDLVPMMQLLGVSDVFNSQQADLSKATTNGFVDTIFQETGIVVEEDGVEAASMTEIGVSGNAIPEGNDTIEVYDINRSFFYIISTDEGIPLYIGVNQSIE